MRESNFSISDFQAPALPNELPPPPDLSTVPAKILHSGTIETLIGQNDDLMARLKVNIRRNAVLEQQIMEHENATEALARTNTSLLGQLQTLKEKDGILRDKAGRAESSQASLKAQLEQARVQMSALHEDIVVLKRSERYRDRVRAWVHPLVKRLRAQLNNERKTVFAKEAQVSDLRARLTETSEHALGLERKFGRDQARLVEQYETQKKTMVLELEELRTISKLLREKANVVDQALRSEAASRNHIVAIERDNEALRNEALRLQGQLKSASIDSEARASELEISRQQVDHMQLVWAEAQKRLEIAKRQNETLNLLNQELGRQNSELRAQTVAPTPPPHEGPALDRSC